jgi:hypothetical protein
VIERRLQRLVTVEIHLRGSDEAAATALSRVAAADVFIRGIQYERGPEAGVLQMLLRVRLPARFDRNRFLLEAGRDPGVSAVKIY